MIFLCLRTVSEGSTNVPLHEKKTRALGRFIPPVHFFQDETVKSQTERFRGPKSTWEVSPFERSRPAADASREANGSVIAKHVG